MEGAGSTPNINSGSTKKLKMIIAVLVVLLIVVSSIATFLYLRPPTSNRTSYAQPGFVQLIRADQVSQVTNGGNCTIAGSPGSQYFHNDSNPTGLQEFEAMSCQRSTTLFIIEVDLNGFNSTSYAEFFYKNDQLTFNPVNYSISGVIPSSNGLIASSENYSIYGICNESNYCSELTGIAISSPYVVSITVVITSNYIPPLLNSNMVEDMVATQISMIKSG